MLEPAQNISKGNRRIAVVENPMRSGGKTMIAEITKVSKNRADVRCFTGDSYRNVKLPSAPITNTGQPSGRSGGWRKGQMVLIEFLLDSPQNPIVSQGFGFSANQNDVLNLKAFYDRYPDFTGEIDFQDFHESGYSIKYGSRIVYYDKLGIEWTVIDLDSHSVSIGTDNIPVSKGDKLKDHLDDIKKWMDDLIQAINNGSITPLDGGASFKASLIAAMALSPVPTVPSDLNDTNLTISGS